MWRAILRNTTLALFASLLCSTAFALELSHQMMEQLHQKYGAEARARIERWQQLLTSPASMAEQNKLLLVNSFFNQVKFRSDQDHWQKEDYWATPLELLVTDGGDCEDYSIAKYYTLRSMGVDDEKLRITYVKALRLNQAHMVLAYYKTPDAEPLILDNLTNQVLPANQRDDLFPVYSFNGGGLWLLKQQGQGKRIGTADRLSQWSNMNERLLRQLQGD